jgi:hypothetical protein
MKPGLNHILSRQFHLVGRFSQATSSTNQNYMAFSIDFMTSTFLWYQSRSNQTNRSSNDHPNSYPSCHLFSCTRLHPRQFILGTLTKTRRVEDSYFPSWSHATTDPSWPIQKLGFSQPLIRNIGWILWLIICAACVIAGIGLLLNLSSLWISSTAVLALSSLILIISFWHPWLPVGILIDLLLLISIILKIPSSIYIP